MSYVYIFGIAEYVLFPGYDSYRGFFSWNLFKEYNIY